MSRIGKQPVTVPSGVQASISGRTVSIQGPKGKLSFEAGRGVSISQSGNVIQVALEKKDSSDKQEKANFGTARAQINNMVTGVTQGFKRSLEMNGVGFTAKLGGNVLTLSVGYSHDVKIMLPKEIKCVVNRNTIELECCDREMIGTLAAKIRKVCPPEPYLGKGIKYSEEKIRRKAGKTGKK